MVVPSCHSNSVYVLVRACGAALKIGITKDFKKCGCGKVWKTRDDFLFDKNIKLVRYEPNFENLEKGAFIFNHGLCKAKIVTKTFEFVDLYDSFIYPERFTGGSRCFRHCLHEDDLDACPAKCGCVHMRALIQIIKKWPKTK